VFLARSSGIISCLGIILFAVQVQAQPCPALPAGTDVEKLPTCRLVKPKKGSSAPIVVTSEAKDVKQCRFSSDDIVNAVRVSFSGRTPTAETGCLSIHSTDEKSFIVVSLPDNYTGSTWQVRGNENSSTFQTAPPNSTAGTLVTTKETVVRPFRMQRGEARISLADVISVNYGRPLITKIEPAIADLSPDGLDLILKPTNDMRYPPLHVTIANDEYGETVLMDVLLVAKEGYSDSPTLQSLKIELAHIRKLIADEQYIRAQAPESGFLSAKGADTIANLYRTALNTLPVCNDGKACSELTRAQLATQKLLHADVEYRLALLSKRLSFWGGFRTLLPTTPHREMIKLRELLKKFRDANDRMERWQFRSQDKGERNQELAAEKAYVMGQIKAEDLSADIKDIDVNRWRRVKAGNASAIAHVQQDMLRVSDRIDALAKQQAALSSQASSLAMNLAASAAGVPVEVVSGVAAGDLKKAVVSYVSAELMNPSSPLATELHTFGETLTEANGALSKLHETYKKTEGLKEDVELIAAGIRDPSLDHFLKVGKLAYSKMSGPEVERLNQFIESQKPVQAWIQSAYHEVDAFQGQVDEYRQALKNIAKEIPAIKGNVNKEIQELLRNELKKAGNQGEAALGKLTARMLENVKDVQLDAKAAQSVLLEALSVYPNFIAEANPDLWQVLLARYPGASPDQVIQQVIVAGKATIGNLDEERDSFISKTGIGFAEDGKFMVRLPREAAKVYLVDREILKKVPRINIEHLRVESQDKLNGIVAAVFSSSGGQTNLLSYLAAVASPEAGGAFIAKHVPSGSVGRMWAGLEQLQGSFANEVQEGVRHAVAGSLAAPALPHPTPAPVDVSLPAPSSEQQQQSAMLSMTLNAAFPGAGAALQLAQTFASMDANRQLSQQLTQQSVQLMAAFQEMLRSSNDADFNEAISMKEHTRAVALADAAKAQLAQYNASIDTVLSSANDVDLRIRLYRPYFFYLAEMLRQQFDLFDRSLAMWSGASDSRGFFATKVATDPSLARLALDSEIHLFDWLNRDREATKTDPFLLFVHWQQLVALAESYCVDHGCKPGDNQLGQIGATQRIGMFDALVPPDTRERFLRWKAGPMTEPFTFRLTLDPSKRLLPARFVNIRNLDWNVVPISRGGSVPGNLLQVRHLGHSQIPYEDRTSVGTSIRLRDESMLPNGFTPSNRALQFDLAELASRFQSQTGITSLQSLRALEGYGLYGAYEITVLNNSVVREIDDFLVEIAYIYTDPENVVSERSFVGAQLQPDIEGCSENDDPGTNVSVCRTIFYFAKDECGGEPPESTLQWLAPDAGLEFLFATRDASGVYSMKLCKATVKTPLVQQAAAWQRVSTNCSWANAMSDARVIADKASKETLRCTGGTQ